MRTLRILSYLFSLFQFILVLKLIEIVRGDPIPTNKSSIISLSSQEISGSGERDSRHFFIAQNAQKKRKLKPWLTSSESPTTDYPYIEDDYNSTEETDVNNSTRLNRMDIFDRNSTKTHINNTMTASHEESARLCPVRFFFWKFCPLDIPFVRLLFPKEIIDEYIDSR